MARRGLSAGMSGREKALGGAVLALYLAVLPYVSGPALDLLERLLGTRLGESVRNAIYYYVVFALVVIVFWGYLGRTTRAFLDRPGGVLASAGLGLVAFYGLNEICGRLLGLVLEGQVNLNDEAIVGRMVDAPRTTILIVVVLAPVVEETLFRGYVFGNLREVHRGLAYLVSCLLFALLHVWQFGSAMVIFLAALKGVSEDLYETASIHGAGKWTQFSKITVPLITPVIFYNLITQLCQAFQEFNGPFLVTKGGPNGATTLISILIYNNAFLRHKMGMASAQAWVLFVIVCALTAVAFVSQKKWVYYSDEDGR